MQIANTRREELRSAQVPSLLYYNAVVRVGKKESKP
jgi:hypothetical protein